jgi:NAD-dependent deacetylase
MYLSPQASIVILTGAGISAESGINTFRDANGLWENHPIEEVATPEGFAKDPTLVHCFYNQRRAHLKKVDPNVAHRALARLDKLWPGDFLLVTQNVDDLHERSGSHRMVHMHGELKKIRCLECHTIHDWRREVTIETVCPECKKPGKLRPQVVWFGEMPFELGKIHEALAKCGLFVAIGTSGIVYPAADFVELTNEFAYTLEINLDSTPISTSFFERRTGSATVLVPSLVDELLEGIGINSR